MDDLFHLKTTCRSLHGWTLHSVTHRKRNVVDPGRYGWWNDLGWYLFWGRNPEQRFMNREAGIYWLRRAAQGYNLESLALLTTLYRHCPLTKRSEEEEAEEKEVEEKEEEKANRWITYMHEEKDYEERFLVAYARYHRQPFVHTHLSLSILKKIEELEDDGRRLQKMGCTKESASSEVVSGKHLRRQMGVKYKSE